MAAIPYLNQIVTGDARVLAERIPDESIDLIFTDPVYERIEDYEWLGQIAMRVLKPDRAALVWCTNTDIDRYIRAMSVLRFVLPLKVFMSGVPYGSHFRGILIKTIVCLWLEKGKINPSYIWDIDIVAGKPKNKHHEWSKPPETITKWLSAFTAPGAVVFDPFTGSGTVPAVCKMLTRNYVAFEVDPTTAERARERVLNTQPPLPGLIVEQAQLDLCEHVL